jgi:hypothetical protein
MEDPIPAYASYAPPLGHPPAEPQTAAETVTDLPPSYTPIDPLQTTFTIIGSFIHTSTGPAYQLSRALDQRHYNLFLRRLRPKEQQTALSTPLPFDYDAVLYEIIAGSTIKGHRKSCLSGTLTLNKAGRTTIIERIERPNEKGKTILTVGGGSFGVRKVLRKRGGGDWPEWKDMSGKVVAREVLRDAKDGTLVPVLEVEADLEHAWKEAILACWTAKLWTWFSTEKTKVEERGKGIFLGKGSWGWRFVK